jgi:hypothetical protein
MGAEPVLLVLKNEPLAQVKPPNLCAAACLHSAGHHLWECACAMEK